MRTKNSGDGAIPRHLEDDDLISYLDGEQPRDEQDQTRVHIESCWHCRSRLNSVQGSIENFLRVRRESLLPKDIPPSRPAVDLFRERLADHCAATPERSLLSLRSWSAPVRYLASLLKRARHTQATSGPVVRIATALLIACLVSALVIFSNRVSIVSANELLSRAVDARDRQMDETTQPVIYQKLQVRQKHSKGDAENSITWETWSDAANARFRQAITDKETRRFISLTPRSDLVSAKTTTLNSAPETLEELAKVLQANRMDPHQPLSPSAYQAWRSGVARKSEEITRSTRADGTEVLTLKTVPQRVAAVGTVTEAVMIVRARDWHPVEQQLRVSREQGDEEFQLTEVAYAVAPLNQLDSSVFANSESPATVSVVAEPAPPAAIVRDTKSLSEAASTVAPTPSEAELAAAELDARYALHRVQADLGEPIEVARNDANQIEVRGLTETEQRKREITRALGGIPRIILKIQTVAEAARAKAVKSRTNPVKTPAEKMAEADSVGERTPENDSDEFQQQLSRYLAAHQGAGDAGGGNTGLEGKVAWFSNAAVSHSEAALAEAWALRRLAERYGSTKASGLRPADAARLEELVRDHTAKLQKQLTELRRLTEPFLRTIATGGTTGPTSSPDRSGENWDVKAKAVFTSVNQVNALTRKLFAGGTQSSSSGGASDHAARELLGVFDALEQRLNSMDKAVLEK